HSLYLFLPPINCTHTANTALSTLSLHDALPILQTEPVRDAARVGDAVLRQRQRDRRLDEPDVAGPEREDRRDVHQHEHEPGRSTDRKSTRLNSSHLGISYAVFCLKKKTKI